MIRMTPHGSSKGGNFGARSGSLVPAVFPACFRRSLSSGGSRVTGVQHDGYSADAQGGAGGEHRRPLGLPAAIEACSECERVATSCVMAMISEDASEMLAAIRAGLDCAGTHQATLSMSRAREGRVTERGDQRSQPF